jgi:hypothetical protein
VEENPLKFEEFLRANSRDSISSGCEATDENNFVL